ncbi:MAG: MmcQ/YjbR family DNA-binding protein [Bacteroidales bacterium]
MNIEDFREYCIQKKGVTESFPFGDDTLVLKVGDKIFALANLNGPFTINLKCDPEKAIELRERYPSIRPGYHMNKQHWNTIEMDGSLPQKLVKEMIDLSYSLIYNKLPKSVKLRLG